MRGRITCVLVHKALVNSTLFWKNTRFELFLDVKAIFKKGHFLVIYFELFFQQTVFCYRNLIENLSERFFLKIGSYCVSENQKFYADLKMQHAIMAKCTEQS